MSYIQQRFTQFALLVDELQVLYEEYEAEKRDRDAPFQQRQSELEIELKTLKQDREAASKEVEQKYKPRFDKLTWFIPQPQPDQAAESPASPNVGPGVRGGRNTGDRLSNDDGSAHDDGSEDDDDGSGHDDDGSGHDDGSENNDGLEDNDDGSDYSDSESEDSGGESENNDDGPADNDNRSAHNHDEPTSAASISPRAFRKCRLTAKARSDLERPNKRRRRGGKAASSGSTSIQPISGEFYQVYWHGAKTRSGTRSGTPYVALCLPTGNFDTVGISGSIYDTPLVRSIPKCYRTHTRTNKILGWDNDYQDGGTKASQRKFPFLFFTGDVQVPPEGELSIPKKGKVLSWVAANDIQPLDLNDSTTSGFPGHATVVAFASKLLHQHGSATAINNQSFATDSGPLSNAGNDDGFGDQSQAEGSQEALAVIASAGLLASTSEPSRRSANAEQPAADTFRSEPKPAPSDRADSSAPAAFDIIVQRLYSQLLDEDADTAQSGLTSVIHLPNNSEDSKPGPDNRPNSENRPSFGDNRPSFEDNRPSSEDSRPNFQNNRPRPEDNRQDIRAEIVTVTSLFGKFRNGVVPVPRGPRQRHPPVLVLRVDVGLACGEQMLDDGLAPVLRGPRQGRPAISIFTCAG
ncbi:hypothetical protein GGTG_13497 [Gaeumannomyces tritici R3-111a-1]|uniref:Uncharacterized protein n=1 Tax=Gaeumannomyces tritici (strain R3-111a-1) TaxID=644352 RepID=J3PJ15_GAET3|nr:hypothetical protein GGTG_13497 [Gaeumannomyces tritici R3-111a-1]EJT68904.1 hypothetical protein GGTG_13497 [Gaeumannomyces tritici R3-111a-1]